MHERMKLGVIGCGKMGAALLGGVLRSGVTLPSDTVVYDKFPEAAKQLADSTGAVLAESNAALVEASEVVLLCTKPQGFSEMLGEIGDLSDRLLISIAAGIRLDVIESATANRHRVVRVMPNTPALVGKGASAYALGSRATEEDADTTETLLGAVGLVRRVSEADLDAVTALSGSGPAYVFLLIECLVEAAVAEGLSGETALALAAQTVSGAAELLQQSGDSPAHLRENVTSPNGTTFAALESFRADDFSGVVRRAVSAAAERSRELGRS